MKSFSAFCSEYNRARPSTARVCRSFHVYSISYARSTVTVSATAMPTCRVLCTGA